MRIHVRSNGCARRQAEAARTRAWATARGMTLTGPEDADVIVAHTCVVNAERAEQTTSMLSEYADTGARCIVAGCAPQAAPHIVPPEAETVRLGRLEDALPGIDAVSSADACRCVQIASGCLGACAYCVTRRATGALRSRPVGDIVAEVESVPEDELMLIAEDVLAWGRDASACLADLLDALPPRRYCLDNGSPEWLADQHGRILSHCLSGRICSMTVSVQSFSAPLLARMGRRYDPDETLRLLRNLNEATDLNLHMMVGFDGETEVDFAASMAALRSLPRAGVNVFRYSPHDLPRYGAPVPEATVERRWREMSACTRPRANNRGYAECRL